MTALKDMTKDELIKQIEQLKKPLNLAQKIAKANKEIGTIDKDGNNTNQHYQYQSMEAIRAAVRRVLYENGLAVYPSFDKPEYVEKRTARGHMYTFARVMGHFEVTDGKESKTCDFPGEGSDTGDKSVQKACTSAQKYFYKEIFNVSDRDEQDPDSTDSAPEGGYVADNYQPRRQSNYQNSYRRNNYRSNYRSNYQSSSQATQQSANQAAKKIQEISQTKINKAKIYKVQYGASPERLVDIVGWEQDGDDQAKLFLSGWRKKSPKNEAAYQFIVKNGLATGKASA